MFFVPFAVGWLAAGRTGWPVVLLLIASSAVFLSRESLLYWSRARHYRRSADDSGRALALYAATAAAAGVPLLMVWKLYALIPFALVSATALLATAELAVRRQGRSAVTEFVAIATSALNAATAHYAATGRWTAEAAWLWALCTLYFASSIFYVKLRVQDAHGKRPDDVARARRRCASYHTGLVAALVALVITRSLPVFALLAFMPFLARAFAQVVSPSRQLNLKRIGWLEVAWSLIFLAVLGVGFGS
jgi:hypothetical protein